MQQSKFKGVIYLTEEQYKNLRLNGSVEIEGTTITYEPYTTIYITPDNNNVKQNDLTQTANNLQTQIDGVKVKTGETAPTTETIGDLGQFYLDTVAKKLYQCVSVTTDESAGTTTYEWQAVGGGIDTLSGTTAPTSRTIGKLGQIYIDTAKNCSYVCIQTNNTTYSIWMNIGGGGSRLGSGNINCYMSGSATDVGNSSVNISGYGTPRSDSCVNIGYLSGSTSNRSSSTAVGYRATYSANDALALGYYASANANKSIQIGQGTNSTANSIQIRDDNIYKTDTHTLTVQNIELNGVDLGTQLGDLNTALETILGV